MPATQLGFLIGFKTTDIWLFPEQLPTKFDVSHSVTYTMSGDSKSLRIGAVADVSELARLLTNQATLNLSTQLELPALPAPFNTVKDYFSNVVFYLESLRLTINTTVGGTTAAPTFSYKYTLDMGVSVDLSLVLPAPLNSLSLKRVYLKVNTGT